MTVNLAVVNKTTVLNSKQVLDYTRAQQTQINRDFFPHYSMGAHLTIRKEIPSDSWALVLLDDSDQANALGYHFLTPAGLPLARVFVKTDIADGLNWTVTASHEVIEMLGDPWVNTVILTSGSGGRGIRLWAKELSDMTEADEDGYDIDGVSMSNFALPSWFDPQGTAPYDYKGLLTGPFQIRPKGYMSVLDIQPRTNPNWQQVFGSLQVRRHSAHSSRQEHRTIVLANSLQHI